MSPTDSAHDVPPLLIEGARSDGSSDLSVRIDGATIFVIGVLDAATSHLLLAAVEYLQATGRVELQVDLGEVPRIDSEGIRVLFDLQQALADVGGQLRILAPPTLIPRLVLCRVELSPHAGGRQRWQPTTG
jgi:anti-anti-sigma factor